MVSMIVGIVLLALLFAVYSATKSIVVTIVACVALVLLERTLEPFIQALWEKKFPAPKLSLFYEKHMDTPEMKEKGIRILVMARTLAFDPKFQKSREQMKYFLEEAVSHWTEESELFKLRMEFAKEKSLPVQIYTGVCKEEDADMRKAFKTWQKMPGVSTFQMWHENQDMFFYDGVIKEDDCMAAILFDRRMPKNEEYKKRQ